MTDGPWVLLQFGNAAFLLQNCRPECPTSVGYYTLFRFRLLHSPVKPHASSQHAHLHVDQQHCIRTILLAC